jgi:hypothetical protein
MFGAITQSSVVTLRGMILNLPIKSHGNVLMVGLDRLEVPGFDPGRAKRFFPSPKRPYQPWGPHTLVDTFLKGVKPARA